MSTTEAEITAALQQWRAESYSKEINKIHIAHLFSEQWESRIKSLWEAYSGLEKRRVLAGAARLPWQDDVEEQNKDMWAPRKRWFNPLPERLRRICPLSVHLARYQGRPQEDDDRRLNGWGALLDDWKQMNELMTNDKNFRETLSPTQERSYYLLRLWWASTCCDEELLAATRTYLESQRSVQTFSTPSTADKLAYVAKHIKADTSKYHASLFKLFLLEFHPMCWEPNVWRVVLIPLQTARYESSCLATVQQMAYAVLHPGNSQQEPYPRTVKNDEIRQRMAMTQTSHRHPYYLWDTERDKTVIVEDLPMCPEYICISHTWGRWRTRTNADIPGVPWPVPEVTRYDVKGVPEKLRHIGQRYIWLDLFCIPQERSPRAEKEIANQASIFKGSSRCLAWINDVDSWDGVTNVLDWIGLKSWSIMSTGGEELVNERLLEASSSAEGSMELLTKKPDPRGIYNPDAAAVAEPVGWFSSLWTLQECALCPDMELYNCTLERLEDRCGTPISLRTLMVVVLRTESLFDEHADTSLPNRITEDGTRKWECPAAVGQLYDMATLTRLDEVLTDGSPIPIMVHSNSRQSTSSRAPAIMSAIGVTDWYLPSINNKNKEPLVFDKYPLSFVREAATKLGAQFYSCTGKVQRLRKVSKLLRVAVRNECEGSMLPFVKLQGWYSNTNALFNHAFIDVMDHDCVSSWTINENGSVAMRSVGVAMTSQDEPTADKVGGVLRCAAVEDGKKAEVHRTGDMLETLKSLTYGSRCIYAVALYKDCLLLHGVLLEQLPLSMFNKQYLVKIGIFCMVEAPLPPRKNVRWEVL